MPKDVSSLKIDILNTYAFERYPEEKVKCIKCNSHKHKYGFTGLLETREKILLGSKCGQDIFGETWTNATQVFKEVKRRQYYLHSLDYLLPLCPTIEKELFKWLPAIRKLEASRKRFQNSLGSLYSKLQYSTEQENNQLFIELKVRDYGAEAQQKSKGEKWHWVTEPIHSISGPSYFHKINPIKILTEARELIKSVENRSTETETVSTSEMKNFDFQLRQITEKLDLIYRMYQDSILFFQRDNLEAIASWATRVSQVNGYYSVIEQGLVETSSGETMSLPKNYPEIEFTPVSIIKDPKFFKEKVA